MKKPVLINITGWYLVITGILSFGFFRFVLGTFDMIDYFMQLLMIVNILSGILILLGSSAGRILILIKFVFLNIFNILALTGFLLENGMTSTFLLVAILMFYVTISDIAVILVLYINKNIKNYFGYRKKERKNYYSSYENNSNQK